jgi:hypothetical protein
MLDKAIASLQAILNNNPWLPQVAGILPLSALLDFIDVPRKLHVFQLVGGVPLWSWPITPSGSRLFHNATQPPCLDRYGSSTTKAL